MTGLAEFAVTLDAIKAALLAGRIDEFEAENRCCLAGCSLLGAQGFVDRWLRTGGQS